MSSHRWQKGLGALAALSTMGMLMAGCGPTANNNTNTASATTRHATVRPLEGGNILLDTTSNFKDIDPALAYFTTDYEIVAEMYEQLVTYQGPQGKIVPGLAQNYTVSPDGLTYTFHIRHNIKFWNGDAVTAQSFVNEFERVLGKGGVTSPGEGFIDPIIEGSTAYHNNKAKTISGITTPTPYTLKIKLTKPEPFFNMVLAMPFFSAVDQSFIDKSGLKNYDSTVAMGTGPFMLQSKDANGAVIVKNPHYWRTDSFGQRLPYLNKVTIRINKNGDVDSLNFEQGTTAEMGNLFQGIPSSSFPKFKMDPRLRALLVSEPQNSVWYLGLNSKVAPFNNVKVREALSWAINKAKIVKLQNGRGQVANQPLPPGLPGYMQNLPANVNYKLNPAKAKALLKKAGFPHGFTTTLYSQNDPDFIKMTNSIQFDLAQIGVKANIRLMADNEFWTQAMTGKLGFFIGGWIQDFPDPSDFLNTLLNSNEAPTNNLANYSNKQVDAWLNKAQTDMNQQQRLSLYDKVTVQVMKDAPWIPLYYPVAYYAAQKWVHGFYISPTLPDPLQTMWIDKGHSQG